MSARPAKSDGEDSDMDVDLDAVLGKINKGLDKIHKRSREVSSEGRAPTTTAFQPAKLKKTRMAFQALSEDSLLTDSGEDIKVKQQAAEEPKAAPLKPTVWLRRGPPTPT